MAKITVSLVHEFDNGETSSTSTTVGSLGASQASALEQVFLTQVTQTLLRLGRYNAEQRDAAFPAMLQAIIEIAGKQSPGA